MTIQNHYNFINNPYYSQINFREGASSTRFLTKPINTVDNAINNTVDTFVKQPEDEEKKKSNKTLT